MFSIRNVRSVLTYDALLWYLMFTVISKCHCYCNYVGYYFVLGHRCFNYVRSCFVIGLLWAVLRFARATSSPGMSKHFITSDLPRLTPAQCSSTWMLRGFTSQVNNR